MSKPALLLVHGFPLDARMWSHQVEGLSDIRTVLAPDLPGHGADTNPALETVAEMAAFLEGLLGDLDLAAVDLAGFSMGGYVCFEFWRRYPQRVRSLVLLNTRASAETDAGRTGRDETRAKVSVAGASVVADAMLPRLLTESAPAALREEAGRWMLESRPATVLADLLALRDRPESVSTLPTVDVRTLVVAGAQDQITTVADAQQMGDGIPGARLVVVTGAAHLSPVEKPDAVNSAIRSHLSTVQA